MAQRDYREYQRYHSSYVHGNAVRKAVPDTRSLPQRQKSRQQLAKERNRRLAAQRNRERLQVMDKRYVIFLSIMTAVCFSVCIGFLYVKAQVTDNLNAITALEQQISDLSVENSQAANRLDASMTLKEVEERALDMGMTFPEEDQVQTYTVEGSDYMSQFEDIE